MTLPVAHGSSSPLPRPSSRKGDSRDLRLPTISGTIHDRESKQELAAVAEEKEDMIVRWRNWIGFW